MKIEATDLINTEPIKKQHFVNILQLFMVDFPKRSQEIIFSRYGISTKKALTLEEIGNSYGITRERVRQVIREVFKKIKDKKETDTFQNVAKEIKFTVEKNSGIMEENKLLSVLGKDDRQEKGALKFFLECIGDVSEQEIKGEMRTCYTATGFSLASWRLVKVQAQAVLKKEGQPIEEKDFFKKVSKEVPQLELDSKTFLDYLDVSEEIKKNNFQKWGLAEWKEVNPKGTREKAFLVLKEAGKPLHFKKIAQQIDIHHLNKKVTHPQTVHNELIKDKKFVLVGRGMYALSEWGYKKGTVKDVIAEILKQSPAPLSKEEVLNQVLKIRYVKKSTIVINLNNFFTKTPQGYVVKK